MLCLSVNGSRIIYEVDDVLMEFADLQIYDLPFFVLHNARKLMRTAASRAVERRL